MSQGRKRLKIYVAGKTQVWRHIRDIQNLCRRFGHTITYDWTEVVEKHGGDSNEVPIPRDLRMKYAMNDMLGVYYADVVIAVGHENLCGTLWECGMAAAFGKSIWLYRWGPSRNSIFENLPNVRFVCHQFALIDLLENKVIPPPTGTTEAMTHMIMEQVKPSPPPDFKRLLLYYEERTLEGS